MESMQLRKERRGYLLRVKNGGLVFYICAAATVLNMILYFINFPVFMPVALHTTQYWLIENAQQIGLSPVLGAVLTVLIACGVAVAGYFAREKRNYWVYSIGTVLFAMDILNIFAPGALETTAQTGMLLSNYDSTVIFIFDVYAAIMMFIGLRAMRKVNELDEKAAQDGMTPIGDQDNPEKEIGDEQKRQYEAEKKKKGFVTRRQDEQSIVSMDPSVAWPEPAAHPKKAKAARLAQEDSAAQQDASDRDDDAQV